MINVLESISFSADLSNSINDDINIPFNFHLVTTWAREDSDCIIENEVIIRLISPTGEGLGETVLKLVFNETQNIRYNVNIKGFPYRGDGIYRYVVYYMKDGEQVEAQRVPINVDCTPLQVS